MKDKGCNGLCERHPNKTRTRLDYRTFNRFRDAICRKCSVYFRNFANIRCPCCGFKLSRTIRRVSRIQIDVLVGYAFTNFWKMIYKLLDKTFGKPLKILKKRGRKPKDYSLRQCTECKTTETYKQNDKHAQWYFVNAGWKCSRCGVRLKCYWRNQEKKRIEVYTRC